MVLHPVTLGSRSGLLWSAAGRQPPCLLHGTVWFPASGLALTWPLPPALSSQVLIGHISKKMNKQTFPEHCSLCKEILPFTDRKQAVCSNGHIWLR